MYPEGQYTELMEMTRNLSVQDKIPFQETIGSAAITTHDGQPPMIFI